MRRWPVLFVFQYLLITPATAFAPSSLFKSSTNLKLPSLIFSTGNDSSDAMSRNTARTCVRIFLTQRAIQSFMFLCEQCRDPHTVNWIQDTYGWSNLNSFHGTGAFNTTLYETWDSVLNDMMTRPTEVVIVRARRRGGGRGGGSKNNPYLEDRFVEFEIEIEPVSLASRIISVREQLAKEWEQDFETIHRANEMILSSYFENVMYSRDEEEAYDPEDSDPELIESDTSEDSAPQPSLDSQQNPVFERNAMQMLLDEHAFETHKSSPLRKGSYDLMILLATQESIHRVLRNYKESENDIPFEWLRDFYTDRLSKFDGNQGYGSADDFLEQLLLTSPSAKKSDGKIALIDPLGIAEDIIRTRGEVVLEWKDIMSLIPQEHMQLRKSLLALQMGKTFEEEEEKEETTRDLGSFE